MAIAHEITDSNNDLLAPPPTAHRSDAASSSNGDESGDELWEDAHEEFQYEDSMPGAFEQQHPGGSKWQNDIVPESHDNVPPSGAEPRKDRTETEYPHGREVEETFTDDEIREMIKRANDSKGKGNDSFRLSKWDAALGFYGTGLDQLPKRRRPAVTPKPAASASSPPLPNHEEDEPLVDKEPPAGDKGKQKENDEDTNAVTKEETTFSPPPTELEKECATIRSILNANMAACFVKKGNHEEAVKHCTEALADDPQYVKALQRRAMSNEEIGSWNALTSAEADYKAILDIVPASSAQLRAQVAKSLRSLPSRIEAAKKKEMDEMIGKLKDLGNTVLGKFGLSTDNFQFTPNGSGGYSMNFAR